MLERGLLSVLPRRPVCFQSLLCVPSLPTISPVRSAESFLPLYTPSFCLFLLHVAYIALRHIELHHPLFAHSVHLSGHSCSCLPPSSFVTSVYSLVSSANLSRPYSTMNTVFRVVNAHKEESRSEARSLRDTT